MLAVGEALLADGNEKDGDADADLVDCKLNAGAGVTEPDGAAWAFGGLGAGPPIASWGNMVADGRDNLLGAWWVATFPGLTIVLTVLAFNLVGDGLRDALDPRLRS